MLEELKKEVCEANLDLVRHHLVLFTWGNVSGLDRERGLFVIKPSGVSYDDLRPEMLPVIDVESGTVVEGDWNPSSDTATHLALYRAFPEIGGVAHTHSTYATSFAQAGMPILPYGTTHADHFPTRIPCTRKMTVKEIEGEYEKETGTVIIEAIRAAKCEPKDLHAVLVHSHGPFTYGKDAKEAVISSAVLENVAEMAYRTEVLTKGSKGEMQTALLNRHFFRKHGPGATYGQKGAKH